MFELLQSWLGLPDTLTLVLIALFSGGAVAGLVRWMANLRHARTPAPRERTAALRTGTGIPTGLANRRAFDKALAGLLHGQASTTRCSRLQMLDLDRFKTCNNEFGHLAGDQALRVTGRLLGSVPRPSGMAARYGGEGFVLLLPDADVAETNEVAARILDTFRRHA